MRIKRLADNILQMKIRLRMGIRRLRMKKLADKTLQLKIKSLGMRKTLRIKIRGLRMKMLGDKTLQMKIADEGTTLRMKKLADNDNTLQMKISLRMKPADKNARMSYILITNFDALIIIYS